MFMASNYTDSFAGDPYYILKGEQLSAVGVNAALNTKEKVANKTDAIDSSNNSSTAQYPSVKAVSDSLNAKDNGALHKAGAETITGVKTFGTTDAAAEPLLGVAKTTAATDDGKKIATEAQVYNLAQALDGLKLPVGTILMYDGRGWVDNQTIIGWYACIADNSRKDCPDLVDRFIKGSILASRATGGNTGNTVTINANNLPAHTHALSGTLTTGNQSADHTHSIEHDHAAVTSGEISGDNYAKIDNFDAGQIASGRASQTIMTAAWNATGESDSDARSIKIDLAHTHSVDLPNYTGNSGNVSADHTHSIDLTDKSTGNNTTTASALNIEPQSYALIYIRRCE
jgi:hypothetical protein